ncbi:MAG: proline--tRNA ligase [bacterium]
MEVKDITNREEDFGAWYTDVCSKADLVDYSSVKGSMIIRPLGYALWEEIQKHLDKMFKETNHENIQMPMFIPESLLNVEKEHVKGFAPEVAWVTHGGSEKLEERLCVRPTSEVLFCEHYKKIIKSYRDLPKLYNQWCTIVRWEKSTRPFLRSREIMWQEGHTMHENEEEAVEETLRMLNIYKKLQEEYLALPVITGKKTEKEKFAGAKVTYTLEAMMQNGVALQNGTSHYFGDGFAKSFKIEYLNKENKLVNPHQTSWGVSTRMIGSIIMTHGDDRGLVLPPNIAPFKTCIVPIGDVSEKLDILIKELKANDISYKCDTSNKTPGFKFAEAEVKGYPIRIELGKRDLEENKVTLVRRDTLEKIVLTFEEVVEKTKELLPIIQKDMFDKALSRRNEMIYSVDTYEEFLETATKKDGFIKINWCGCEECENKIKDDTSFKSRCLIDEEEVNGKCCVCGKEATTRVYFGKQY